MRDRARYRTLLDELEEGCFETDLQGNFVYANNLFCASVGLRRDQILGLNFRAFSMPKTARVLREAGNRIFHTGKAERIGDCEFLMRNRDVRVFEIRVSLMKDLSGRPIGFRGLLKDITERTRAERALQKSEERYRTFLDSIDEGYFEVDLKGTITFVNDTMCRIMGSSRDKLIGLNHREYTDKATAEKTYRIFNEIFQTGAASELRDYSISVHGRLQQIWGMRVSLLRDPEGRALGFRGIVRDVTEKKRAEQKLEENERRHRTILENTGTAIILVENDIITFAGGEFEKLSGYNREDIEGKMKWTEFVPPEERSKIFKTYCLRLATDPDPGFPSDEFGFVNRRGEVRNVYATVSNIPGTKQILASLIDITDYKKLENRFLQIRKMEAIGTLAGGIAHNFNNLLMCIQGNVSLALMNLNPDQPMHQRMKNIEEKINEGAELTRQLLGFARGGKYDVKKTDINYIIGKTADLFERTRKDIKIHRSLQNNIWSSALDQCQMEQAFMNIFVNAWQAMEAGGDLYIETKNRILDNEDAETHGLKPGRYVHVLIQDTGEGMDSETKKRAFEPFFTTKSMGRGSGLGLASTYGIVKSHGGIITLDSEKGKGTACCIFLPALKEKKVRCKETETKILFRGSETILLVDDDEMMLDVGNEILKMLGYQVILTDNGQEAIRIYEQHMGIIELVILDMVMPEMGGGVVYDRLKELNEATKVLLSSGYSIDGEAEVIINRGCNGFIQKPFDVHMLSKKVREILDLKE